MTRNHPPSPRGFVLISVLVIVSGALLVATGMVFMVRAEQAGLAQAKEATQGRALAWSGVRAVMSRLNDQRGALLRSQTPELEDQYTLYEIGGRAGVVRLLPVGGDRRRIIPESGKLDLNRATSEMLEATGLVDSTLSQAIINYRAQTTYGIFQSVAELLRVEGMTPDILYGPPQPPLDNQSGSAVSPEDTFPSETGLTNVVTVYGVEPALQRSGNLRINLNVPWSEELGRRVEERFDQQGANGLKRVFENGTKFEDEARLYQVLRFFGVEPEIWPDIVDTFTAAEEKYHYGRVNLNLAPEEVLAALPGVSPEQATTLIQMRADLDPDERDTVAWPAIHGIFDPEQYDDLAGWLTTRSWTFRLRLATGEVDRDLPDGPLQHPLILEVVIDLASPQSRVAYLRDITMLETAVSLAAADLPDDREPPETHETDVPGGDTEEFQMNEEQSEGAANSPETMRISPRRIGRWRKVSG